MGTHPASSVVVSVSVIPGGGGSPILLWVRLSSIAWLREDDRSFQCLPAGHFRCVNAQEYDALLTAYVKHAA